MSTENEQNQVQPETKVEKKEPRNIPLKGKRIAVGTGGNVGYWEKYGWDDRGNLGDWYLKQITFDLSGQMWCVGTGNNVGKYDPTNNKMTPMGNLGSWSINSIAFDIDGKLWAVGTGGNVGVWDGSKMKLQGNNGFLGDWSLKYLTFDQSGRIWCVGTGSNVGIYDPITKKMDDRGFLGDWSINSIAFELDGSMYAVGTGGNVGIYDPITKKMDDQGNLGDWSIACLDFNYPMEVLSMDYAFEKKVEETSTESAGSTAWYKNGSEIEQETQLVISAERKSTHTFSWQNETEVGLKMTSKVGVPLVGKTEFELSVSNTYTFGETETNEHTQSWEWTNIVKAPPYSQVKAVAKLNRADITVPFVATVSYRGQTIKRDGIFKGSDYFNMDITVEQTPYPSD